MTGVQTCALPICLGLSIAKTIIERHDGTMEIILDGDLFKVVIAIK